MTNLALHIKAHSTALDAELRADRIRLDTLVQLARALSEDHDNSVRNALDELIGAVGHDLPEGELEDLVGDVEDTARMDAAVIDLTPGDLQQLSAQAQVAVNTLVRRARPRTVPALREAGAA